jgi:hypothetical protein
MKAPPATHGPARPAWPSARPKSRGWGKPGHRAGNPRPGNTSTSRRGQTAKAGAHRLGRLSSRATWITAPAPTSRSRRRRQTPRGRPRRMRDRRHASVTPAPNQSGLMFCHMPHIAVTKIDTMPISCTRRCGAAQRRTAPDRGNSFGPADRCAPRSDSAPKDIGKPAGTGPERTACHTRTPASPAATARTQRAPPATVPETRPI